MLYLHLFSSFFHFRLYSTSRISDIAVPRFVLLLISLWQLEDENNFYYEKVDSLAVGYHHANLV